jgi:hypothetical protein
LMISVGLNTSRVATQRSWSKSEFPTQYRLGMNHGV